MEPRDTVHPDAPTPPTDSRPSGDPGPPAGVADRAVDGLGALAGSGVARMATTDVGVHKAKARSARLQRTAFVLGLSLIHISTGFVHPITCPP